MNEAIFIWGYCAALQQCDREPTDQIAKAAVTARQIVFEGGALNPLHVYELKELAFKLGYRAPKAAT